MEWHRIFGVTLTDFFTNTAFKVELERDLSLQQQFLDVVIIEKGSGEQIAELPDGLENLSRHNLLTYKSIHQPLDDWALDELIGHYVNYRKQSSASSDALLPVEDFRLFAVCTREPQKLASAGQLQFVKEGVHEILWGSRQIRVIVLSQIPEIERNAIWQLFSGIPERVQFGASHYHWRRPDNTTVIHQLYKQYKVENIAMPYTVEDFYKEFTKENLDLLTPEERLTGLSIDDVLKKLSVDDLLRRLSTEEILKRLSAEEIEAYLKKLRSASKAKAPA